MAEKTYHLRSLLVAAIQTNHWRNHWHFGGRSTTASIGLRNYRPPI